MHALETLKRRSENCRIMELLWQKCTVVLCLFLLTRLGFTEAWDSTCPLSEEALEPITFIKTSTEQEDLRQTSQIRHLETETVGEGYIDELVASLSEEEIMKNINQTSADVRSVGDFPTGDPYQQDITVPNYFETCPHKWLLLRRAKWYWRILKRYKGYTNVHYCFSYWWVWATYCPFCLCSLNYYPFETWWDPRFRCFPVYRVVWLPLVCCDVEVHSKNVNAKWTRWFWRRVYVPRGCCCRKFWPFLEKNDKCPAKIWGKDDS